MKNNSVWEDHNSLLLERKTGDMWQQVQSYKECEIEQAHAARKAHSEDDPSGTYRLIQLHAVEIPYEIDIPIAELVENYNTSTREIDLRPKSYIGKYSFSR